jgi:hypothetical protein
MIPDFPELKKSIYKNLRSFFQQESHNDSMFAMASHTRHYEGDLNKFKSIDGHETESPYKRVEGSMNIPIEEIIEDGPNAFIKHGRAMAEDMKKQAVQNMFSSLNEAVESVGNTLNAGGQPLTPEHILQMLEKMFIPFNDDGTPSMLSLVVHPDMRERVLAVGAQLEGDPQLKARHAEIMKKKKEEWDASEGNRKLVD